VPAAYTQVHRMLAMFCCVHTEQEVKALQGSVGEAVGLLVGFKVGAEEGAVGELVGVVGDAVGVVGDVVAGQVEEHKVGLLVATLQAAKHCPAPVDDTDQTQAAPALDEPAL